MITLKHFAFEELVPPETAKRGAAFCFGLFYESILIGIDLLRNDLGFPIYINDWHLGGDRKYCGYRPRNCSVGASASFHKSGGAFDLHAGTDEQLKTIIAAVKKNPGRYGVRRMETPQKTPGWVHVDCKEHGRPSLHIFEP